MPRTTEGIDLQVTEETETMTQDLEILKELSLPLLEEMAPYPSILAGEIARGETFWTGFSNSLLGTHWQLKDILADHKIKDTERYLPQLENLQAAYIAALAQQYCAGHTNPSITMLLARADAAFGEEVDFQKHLLVAITQAGRDELRNELKLADEFADEEIADEEISRAFDARHRDATRNELREQLQQWEEEPVTAKPKKRKRFRAIPFLFFRFAAAAAVGVVATVGVVTVYNSKNEHDAQAVKPYNEEANRAGPPAPGDSTAMADTLLSTVETGTTAADSAKANAAPLYITLKGFAVDTASNEVLTNVTITMLDEKGKKHTVFSKDGKFRLRLPLHHDFEITGKKDGYHSARLSLSTMDAKKEDAGDVIEVVLRFSKDQ
ncbi:MAG: hypothetical protein K0Q79_910 [Flavipsychrobacter sp.]|nr:hypothetical protein [Flavipsychrobacter sp.]